MPDDINQLLSRDVAEQELQWQMARRHAELRVQAELETKLAQETTLYHEQAERHHRYGALNPSQEGRVRRHLDAIDRAHNEGDLATARTHTAALRTYLDGLATSPDDDEQEPSTPRRSSTNRRQPAIAPEPPPGDEVEGSKRSQRLVERAHLAAVLARLADTLPDM
jgi:hypothetical protein